MSPAGKLYALAAVQIAAFIVAAVVIRGCVVVEVLPPDLGAQVDGGDLAVEVDPLWDGKCLGRPGDAGRVRWWKSPDWDADDHEVYPGEPRYECVHHDGGWWFEKREEP